MTYQNKEISLGLLLQNAGLISENKLNDALETQKQYSDMNLGEILVLQAGIRAKTINFFVNQWQEMVWKGKQFPLGYYLCKADLLSIQQIEIILQEQQSNQQTFGVIAVHKGWIEQKTIDFFLNSLSLKPPQIMTSNMLEDYNRNCLHLEQKYTNYSGLLSRILAWTGGNIYLTKTICQVFAGFDLNISAGTEINAVDRFVESSLIKKWQVSKVGEYIRVVKQQLVNNPRCASKLLLQEYREFLIFGCKEYQNTKQQNELILLGLLSCRENKHLKISNMIYQQVFDRDFIDRELKKIEPNAVSYNSEVKNEIDQRSEQASSSAGRSPSSSSQRISADRRFDDWDSEAVGTTGGFFKPARGVISDPETKASVVTSERATSHSNSVPSQERQTKARKTNNSQLKIDIPKSLTIIASLITLGAIASLIPLSLKMNNYYSSQLRQEQGSDFALGADRLKQFCNEIDFSDSSVSLNLISQLEKNQQQLAEFPDNCKVALDKLRIVAAPMLGKESRILEAVKQLCKIPENSEMHLEAKVWLKHWYNSPIWGQKTQLYLQDFAKYKNSDCPAAHFVPSKN